MLGFQHKKPNLKKRSIIRKCWWVMLITSRMNEHGNQPGLKTFQHMCTNQLYARESLSYFTGLETKFVSMSVKWCQLRDLMKRSYNEVANLILKKNKNKCILNCIRMNSVQYHFSCTKMEPGEVLTNSCQATGGNTHPDSLRNKGGHWTHQKCQKYFNVGSCVFPIPQPAVCRGLQYWLSLGKLRFSSVLFSALTSFPILAVQPAWQRNCILKGLCYSK